MKPLSAKQAQNCEQAVHEKCVCRCRGALHGARRGGGTADAPDMTFFENLPEDDPHYTPSEKKKAEERKARAEKKKRDRQEAMERRYKILYDSPPIRPDWY